MRMTYTVMTLIDDISNDIYLKITHDISWWHIPWHMISWHIPWHMVSVHCTALMICNRHMSWQCRMKTYVIRYVMRGTCHEDTSWEYVIAYVIACQYVLRVMSPSWHIKFWYVITATLHDISWWHMICHGDMSWWIFFSRCS